MTAAFDTGQNEFENLFKNLDDAGNERLLTNLDPDRFYPVYGDGSVTVYDAESQGKFYLGVDSEDFKLVLGNYSLDFDETELAAYQRVAFGGKLQYRSVSKSAGGEANTEVVIFGSEGSRQHVRTELRATGGSLYYLRHTDLVEGSEQVALVVRDKNTNVPLSRTPLVQNQDYTIKYREGRIWFDRPIPSVVAGGSMAEEEVLAGHPVYLEIEYEIESAVGDIQGGGARVRQRLGDHLRVGGTYVRDVRAEKRSELRGLDAVVTLPGETRLLGEYAESEGADSLSYVTGDGGLSYDPVRRSVRTDGQAWKAAAELHPGAWLGKPGLIDLKGYVKRLEPGFQVGGGRQERGTRKIGADLGLGLGRLGRLGLRHEGIEQLDGSIQGDSLREETRIRTGEWSLSRGPIRLGLEYQARQTETRDRTQEVGYLSGRVEADLSQSLRTQLRHQQTTTGRRNDQTSVGIDYALTRSLSLEARGNAGTAGESAEGSITLGGDRDRVYLTERYLQKSTGRSLATVIGAETKPWRASRVFTEYQWERRGARCATHRTGRGRAGLEAAREPAAPPHGGALAVPGRRDERSASGTLPRGDL